MTPTLPTGVATSTPTAGSSSPTPGGSSHGLGRHGLGTSSTRSRTTSVASGTLTPTTKSKAPPRRGKGRDTHDSSSDGDSGADSSGEDTDNEGGPADKRKVSGEAPDLFETKLAFQEGYVNPGKHPIYDYFVRHEADADNAKPYVMCIVIKKVDGAGVVTVCGVPLSQGQSSTGMMMKHLRSRHSQAADEFATRYACYRIDQAEVRRQKKGMLNFNLRLKMRVQGRA